MSASEHEKEMECAESPQNKVTRSRRRRNHNLFWVSCHGKNEILTWFQYILNLNEIALNDPQILYLFHILAPWETFCHATRAEFTTQYSAGRIQARGVFDQHTICFLMEPKCLLASSELYSLPQSWPLPLLPSPLHSFTRLAWSMEVLEFQSLCTENKSHPRYVIWAEEEGPNIITKIVWPGDGSTRTKIILRS